MSVPDRHLESDEDDTVWCACCMRMHSPADCEYWQDFYVQQRYDEGREQ